MRSVRFTLVLFTFVNLVSGCKGGDDPIHPTSKPIREAVYASGIIQSFEEHTLYAQKSGKLISKNFIEGKAFERGQLLFVLDDGVTGPRVEPARIAAQFAKLNAGKESPLLKEFDNRISQLRKMVEFDSTNFSRYKNLLKANATSKIDYDRASLAYEKSKRELTQAYAARDQAQNKADLEFYTTQMQVEQLS